MGIKRLNYWSSWTVQTWKKNRELGHPIRRDLSGSIGWQTTANLLKEQEYGEISEILDRSWWRRVWIVQETVLAKQAVLRCGTDEVSWERIRKRTQQPNPLEVVKDTDAPSEYSFPDSELSILDELRSSWRAGTFATTLYELLYKARRLGCTDPRDRIYAFLGLAIDSESIDITPDYSSTISEVYEKLALALMRSHKHLLILNLKRAYHDDRHTVQQPIVNSIADQAKFHDTEANVRDGANHKKRKSWARSPEGWERYHQHGITTYIDHKTGTRQQESPLAQMAAVAPQSIASQRLLLPGWIKGWDNLDRVKFEFRPDLPSEPTRRNGGIVVPSWVPNWDDWSLRDPEPLLSWPGNNLQTYCTSGTSSMVSTLFYVPESPHTVCLQGLLFDEIDCLAPSWHPQPSSYKVNPSRKGQQALELWEELALRPAAACPYSVKGIGREEALWRTHLADHVGDLAAPDDDKAFFEVWCDRVQWAPEEFEEGKPMSLWEAASRPSKATDAMLAAYAHFLDVSGTIPRVRDSFAHRREFTTKYQAYRERIHNTCQNRALFVVNRGSIGLRPWNAGVGDAVCVLYGGVTPFLTRKAADAGTFHLVGESYVSGIMNGEALHAEQEMLGTLERAFRVV